MALVSGNIYGEMLGQVMGALGRQYDPFSDAQIAQREYEFRKRAAMIQMMNQAQNLPARLLQPQGEWIEPPETGPRDHLQRRVNKWLEEVELP